jgi:cell division protein FtsQ
MNELKANNKIVRTTQSGNTSNVSTYVRRYSIKKKRLPGWIKDNMKIDAEPVLHPSLRKFKAEEAASDPERREKAKLLMICVGIAIVLMLIIPTIKIATNYLVIGEIRVEGSSLYSEAELLDAGGLDIGAGLPILKSSHAEKSVMEALPYIQSCEISFELPNVLVFHLVDEAPALYASIEGEYYVLTSSMRVLERTDDPDALSGLIYVELPRVSRAMVGEEIVLEGTSVEYITEFFNLIKESELDGRIARVYFDKKFDIVASVDGKFRVLFGSPSEMELKIASVAKMIEENGEKCTTAGIVDVRVTEICGISLDSNINPEERE